MAQPKQTDPQFKLRLTPALKAQIESAAAKANRSMNAEIVFRLEYFDEISEQLHFAHTKIEVQEDEIARLKSEVENLKSIIGESAYLPHDMLSILKHQAILSGRSLDEEVASRLQDSLDPGWTYIERHGGNATNPEEVATFIGDKLDEMATALHRLKQMVAEKK